MEQSLHVVQSLQSMKVPELREILRKEGLPTTGRKQELIDRILQRRVARFGPDRDLGEPTLKSQHAAQASQTTVRVPTMPLPVVQPAIPQPVHHPGLPACGPQAQKHPAYHAAPPVHVAPVLHAVPVPTTVPATTVVPTVCATVATPMIPTVHATAVPAQGPPVGSANNDAARGSMTSHTTAPTALAKNPAPPKNTGPMRHASRGVFDFLFSDSDSEDIPKVVSSSHAKVPFPAVQQPQQTTPAAPHNNQTTPAAPHNNQTTHAGPDKNQTTPAAPYHNQTTPAAPHHNQTTLAAPRNPQTTIAGPQNSHFTRAVSSSSNVTASVPLIADFSDDEDDVLPKQDMNRAPPHVPQMPKPIRSDIVMDHDEEENCVRPSVPAEKAHDVARLHGKANCPRPFVSAVKTRDDAQGAQSAQSAQTTASCTGLGLAAAQDAIRSTMGYTIENGSDVVSRQHHPVHHAPAAKHEGDDVVSRQHHPVHHAPAVKREGDNVASRQYVPEQNAPALKRARDEEMTIDVTRRTPASSSRAVPFGVKTRSSAVDVENNESPGTTANNATSCTAAAGNEAGTRSVDAENPRNVDNGDLEQTNSGQPRPANAVSLPDGWQIHKKFLGNFHMLQQQVRLGMKENENVQTSAPCNSGGSNSLYSAETTFSSMGTASSAHSLRSFKAFKRKTQNTRPSSQLIRTFVWTEESDAGWGNQILSEDAIDQGDEP